MRSIVIMGEPLGKGRPKFTTVGGYARTYTPKKTADYEREIRCAYQREYNGESVEQGKPINVWINAYYKIPQSASRAKRADMIAGIIRPTRKPDIDNVVKVALDALNGLAWHDDSQVCKIYSSKQYSEMPRLTIEIEEQENERVR